MQNVSIHHQTRKRGSEDLACAPLLPLPHWRHDISAAVPVHRVRTDLQPLLFGDDGVDSFVEYLMHTDHLFARALHVHGTHLLGDRLALGCGDGGESLGFEELDAGTLVPEI